MTQETQQEEEHGPLPRTREAVDWWLKKWGRQAVIDGQEPLVRKDVEGLIRVNGGTAEEIHLDRRNLSGANLAYCKLNKAHLSLSNLRDTNFSGAALEDAALLDADLRGANLFGANLKGARLCLAKLQGASLFLADLHDADLDGARISSTTDMEGVEWDDGYKNALEREGKYDEAVSVYQRLKEWYRGAGMLKIAGEFHYREQEANRKAQWQRLGREFKERLATAWHRLHGTATDGN